MKNAAVSVLFNGESCSDLGDEASVLDVDTKLASAGKDVVSADTADTSDLLPNDTSDTSELQVHKIVVSE